MAGFTYEGFDDLEKLFEQMGALPDSVLDKMLEAEAPIVIEEQKKIVNSSLHKTGTLAGSITGTPSKTGRSGERYKMIYPKGIHHRTLARHTSAAGTKQRYKVKSGQSRSVTNAEVGFIHEAGAPGRNIPASQWMKRANEKAATPALQAAAQEYDNWLKSL